MEQVESVNCLNGLLQEVLDCAPAVILTIFFCKVKNFPTVGRVNPPPLKKNLSIFYNRMKVYIIN